MSWSMQARHILEFLSFYRGPLVLWLFTSSGDFNIWSRVLTRDSWHNFYTEYALLALNSCEKKLHWTTSPPLHSMLRKLYKPPYLLCHCMWSHNTGLFSPITSPYTVHKMRLWWFNQTGKVAFQSNLYKTSNNDSNGIYSHARRIDCLRMGLAVYKRADGIWIVGY